MQRYTNNIKKRIGKTIYQHRMLQPDDRLLIALSGGKDSLVLVEALAARKKSLPFNVDIIAAHVNIENMGYKVDLGYLQNFCSNHGIHFIYRKYSVEINHEKKSHCFICSWNRRKTLFEMAKENKCNKLVFGHHMDDALQTLLMNMMYHGSISSMPYRLKMFDGQLEVIRPMLDITNEELEKYSKISSYKTDIKTCMYENTKRKHTSKIIEDMCGGKRSIRVNLFRAMKNIYTEYLPGRE